MFVRSSVRAAHHARALLANPMRAHMSAVPFHEVIAASAVISDRQALKILACR